MLDPERKHYLRDRLEQRIRSEQRKHNILLLVLAILISCIIGYLMLQQLSWLINLY